MGKVDGKHTIVTGGGAGIGRAIAIRFATEGSRVSIFDINTENAQKVCDEIAAAGGEARCFFCDVSDHGSMNKAVEGSKKHYGPVDFMINNAGGAMVGGSYQVFSECTDEFIDKLIGINLMGTIYGCRAVAQEMKERKTGKIINFSSVQGLNGCNSNALYGTAKGAIVALTKSLAMEMGPYGVTVNAIAPGAIASRPGPAAMRTWLGHSGKCEDVASLALFLASDEGSFITGETVVIDGGRTCSLLGC